MRMGISHLLTMILIVFSLALARVEGLHRVRLHRDEVAMGFLSQERFPSKLGTSSDFICKSCLDVSREVEKILGDPKIIEQVVTALSEVCRILPADSVPKCLGMLDAYVQQAILFLRDFFNKENLCYSTGLCSQKHESFLPMLSFIRKIPSSQAHNVALNEMAIKLSDEKICTSCHNAVEEILKWLEDPEAKLKLIKALLKACDELEINTQKCKKAVFQYGPLLFANLEKYMKNNDVCNMVHFCDGTEAEVAAY